MLDTVRSQRLLASLSCERARLFTLVPLVRRLFSHDAFLHFGDCEVLDTVGSHRQLAPLWWEGDGPFGIGYSAWAVVPWRLSALRVRNRMVV